MGRHCTSPQKLNCEQRNSDTKNHDALVGLLKSSWHIGPQSCHFSVCSLLGSSAPQWPPSKSSFLLYNQSQFLLLVPKEAWEIPWGMLRSLNTFVQSSLWASVYTSILREHILQGSDQMLTSSSMQPSLIHVLEVNMLVFPLYCTSKKLTSKGPFGSGALNGPSESALMIRVRVVCSAPVCLASVWLAVLPY